MYYFCKKSSIVISHRLCSPLTIINQTFLMDNKRAISRFFGVVAPTTQPRFYLFKGNNGKTQKTRLRREMCLKLTVRIPEQRRWHLHHLSTSLIVLPSWDYTCSKSTIEKLKTLEYQNNVNDILLVSLLENLGRFHTFHHWCFHWWLWANKFIVCKGFQPSSF